jgi:S1-C subfamily serine protease
MSLFHSPLTRRVTLVLATTSVFLAILGVRYRPDLAVRTWQLAIWADDTRERRRFPTTIAGVAEGRSGGAVELQETERSSNSAHEDPLLAGPSSGMVPVAQAVSLPRPAGETEDDSVLYPTLERIEERMAVGMRRAQGSVVALEYTAAEGPGDARRVATGIVINSSGDVLSVRIDPPAPSSAGPRESQGNTTQIVARDALGRCHAADWVATDPETGLTLLRITPRAVKPIHVAPQEPTLGAQVIVVGNPFGLGHSVSHGHVAGLDRALKLGERHLGGLIQIRAPLYPGDSGAAVTNLRGQLLGLIRSGLAVPGGVGRQADPDDGFGFAITARDMFWIANQLRTCGHIDRAYLGIRVEPVEAVVSQHLQAPPARGSEKDSLLEGALLGEVLIGGPASLAGLRTGDAIIALDGKPIHSSQNLTDRLDRLPSRTTIQLEVVRAEAEKRIHLTVKVRTTSRPEACPYQPAHLHSCPENHPHLMSPAVSQWTPPLGALPAAGSSAIPSAACLVQTSTSLTPPPPSGTSPSAAEARLESLSAPSGVNPTERCAEPQGPSVSSVPVPPGSPLQAPILPLQASGLKLTLPPGITERLEQFERRLEQLERRIKPTPETQQANSIRRQ